MPMEAVGAFLEFSLTLVRSGSAVIIVNYSCIFEQKQDLVEILTETFNEDNFFSSKMHEMENSVHM